MSVYDSFIFAGHGKSEKTGGYDPGAVSGGVRENDVAVRIVASAVNHLKKTRLIIHSDENNYADNDLEGNSYKFNAGISVHINAGGGTGSEIYVPCRERCLAEDFNLVMRISEKLGIPNRGVKSRDYDSERIYMRTDGVPLGYTDYYKEIREAWKLGVSLAIIEVGFIDSNDIKKIQNNIEAVGLIIAEYIAGLCDVKLGDDNLKSDNIQNTFYRVICGSFRLKANAEERKKELKSKGYSDVFIDKYKY